jgi:hypothetical protein
VVVAVIAVRVMQVAVDQVVDVVPVRHGLVSASRTVHMIGVVPATSVLRRAPVWIGRRYLDGVLVDVIVMHMMQMAIVEIVHVVAVANGCMPARWTVLVGVVGVLGAGGHSETSRLFGARHLAGCKIPHRSDMTFGAGRLSVWSDMCSCICEYWPLQD